MRILAALLFTLLLVPGARASEADDKTLARGRELSGLFLAGKTGEIWPQMSPQMQKAMGSAETLADFRKKVGEQLGEETKLIDEKVENADGLGIYKRSATWSKLPQRILMQWAIDGENHVAGFFVRPDQSAAAAAPTKYLDYQTKAQRPLPFDGEWFVVWGGRTVEQNYHVRDRGQRFAYDLLVVRNGSSHSGDGKKLEDYYCWGQPIRAPADGVVSAAVDGFPDQEPGSMDPAHPTGNHVILDLGKGEFALLAHMRKGSLRVKKGDFVSAGGELGRCGNSGNTSEPHLHFHLQDTPRFGEGDGLPAFFTDYLANGKPVARGEPLKGQRIKRQ